MLPFRLFPDERTPEAKRCRDFYQAIRKEFGADVFASPVVRVEAVRVTLLWNSLQERTRATQWAKLERVRGKGGGRRPSLSNVERLERRQMQADDKFAPLPRGRRQTTDLTDTGRVRRWWVVNVVEALHDRNLLGRLPAIRDLTTWRTWLVVGKAIEGVSMSPDDERVFGELSGGLAYDPPLNGWPATVIVAAHEPPEEQVVVQLLHEQPLAPHRVQDLQQQRAQQLLRGNGGTPDAG
jgi:hypothetical protein